MKQIMYKVILLITSFLSFALNSSCQVKIKYEGKPSINISSLNIFFNNSNNDTLSCLINNLKSEFIFNDPNVKITKPNLKVNLRTGSNSINLKLKSSKQNNIVKINNGYGQLILEYYKDTIYLTFVNGQIEFE